MPFCVYEMKPIRPVYIIDPYIVQENIRLMARKAAHSGAVFRPHFKTHQSLAIGNLFREEGVRRIAVSSLKMAEYFCHGGWDDITVAFPVNLPEIELVNDLASRVLLGLLVEDSQTLHSLAGNLLSPVDIYIKIYSGYHRTGLEPAVRDEILRIAEAADDGPMTRFLGLVTHAGHTYSASGPEEIRQIFQDSMQCMLTVKDYFSTHQNCMVSVGDTPSCSVLEEFKGADELRPGNFVFYDLMQMELGSCRFNQIAGIVAVPVVAVHQRRNQAVIYGGAVHLSKDRILLNGRPVYGQMVGWDGTRWGLPVEGSYLVSVSQEHGVLEAPDAVIRSLKPGTFIGILPVHACLTANLLRGYRLVSGQTADHMQGI